jgi:hypothetical protein
VEPGPARRSLDLHRLPEGLHRLPGLFQGELGEAEDDDAN